MQNLGQCHGQSKGKAELLQAMAWQNRKKAMFAICELLNVLLVSMRSIMSSQTANVFGFEPLCSRTLQLKRQDRVERRQWLPSGSCLKSYLVSFNVFNSISFHTVLLQIAGQYQRRQPEQKEVSGCHLGVALLACGAPRSHTDMDPPHIYKCWSARA